MSSQLNETGPNKRSRVGSLVYVVIWLLSMMALLLFIWGRLSSLTCNRIEPTQIDCTVQEKWWGLVTTRQWTFREVRGAQVDSSYDGEDFTYELQLKTGQGMEPVPAVSGVDFKREVAKRINGFVNDPQAASMQMQEEIGSFDILLLVGGAGFMAWMLFYVRRTLLRAQPH